VSQALHLTLALAWAAAQARTLAETDRLAVMTAVLAHDLGKNLTTASAWPAHHGHEGNGLPLVDALFERLPSLGDARARRLARAVCALHLSVRDLASLRPGTQASMYEDWFKWNAFPVDLFALAVAADTAGRLGLGHVGAHVRADVEAAVVRLRQRCAAVDAAALWQHHAGDRAAFARALHEERARAIARA
jgi:tRNA nucleotidyltransferase (CCA-adding enzyme)